MFRWIRQLLFALVNPKQISTLIPQALSFPAIRALLTSAIIYLIAFTMCRIQFWRDPHSAFFQSETIYEPSYSILRTGEALRLVRQADTSQTTAQPDPLLCSAFVTVKREPVQYLAKSVGSLLEGLYPEERNSLYLHVLFANTEPAVHPDWKAQWVENLVDVAEGYNASKEELEILRKVEIERNFYIKGVCRALSPAICSSVPTNYHSDYVYVLKRCMDTTAPYILVAEDDNIFVDGWMTKTLDALRHLRETVTQPWLYLRLFYTETALRWDERFDFWYANMPLAFGLTMLSTFTVLYVVRQKLPSSQAHLDNYTIALVCLITVPAFTALIFMIGKYSLHPLRGVVKMNKAGCCTQAMVYPRTQAPALIKFLEDRNNGQTDSLIEEYADIAGLDRFALAPQSTWASYFETNDRMRLKKEHETGMAKGVQQWTDLKKCCMIMFDGS